MRSGLLPFPLFPPQASTLAPRTDHLLYYLLAVSATLTVVIAALIVVFAVRYRRRPGNEVATQIVGSHRLELAWTATPLALLMVMYVWGSHVYFWAFTPPTDAMRVNGIGKQWMWKFQHLGGQREINELHVPVHRPVKVLLTSQDVIHSFYVPAFRVKSDVIPGRYTELWFEATRPGSYHLFCAEYCGTMHSGMIGRVVAMEPARFEAWLAGGAALSPARRGERLFQDLGCDTCHRADGRARGPDLTGLAGREVQLQRGEVVVADATYLRTAIVDPGAQLVAGYQNIMPSFRGQVTEEDLLALVTYVQSLGEGTEATP
jgi:cytochrome c oxidase subunit 2